MNSGTLYLLSAFSNNPEGGNPAGVWIGDALPDPAEMQRIAADVGFSETAFIAPPADTFARSVITALRRKFRSAAMQPSHPVFS